MSSKTLESAYVFGPKENMIKHEAWLAPNWKVVPDVRCILHSHRPLFHTLRATSAHCEWEAAIAAHARTRKRNVGEDLFVSSSSSVCRDWMSELKYKTSLVCVHLVLCTHVARCCAPSTHSTTPCLCGRRSHNHMHTQCQAPYWPIFFRIVGWYLSKIIVVASEWNRCCWR